jgi:3-oxoacyl-[acyl-carrier-protein] synthase-3
MKYAHIAGTGSYLPVKRMSNEDIAEFLDTDNEWIESRTGIRARRVANATETTTYMAAEAAKQAMAAAGVKPEQIEMVIVGTCSPDRIFPSTACAIQHQLGIPVVPAFDVQAACSGFIYAMDIANQYLRSGAMQNILIVGVESMSRMVDWKDRSTCVLFGDGAGAFVLSASEKPGIIWSKIKADGKYQDLLYANNISLNNTCSDHYVVMEGSEVFKVAVKTLERLVVAALEENGLHQGEIDWLVPHQANIRIIQAVAKRLGLSMEQVVVTIGEQANTSSASIPLAFDQAVRDGRIKRGQLTLLEAFGGGFTWGASLVRY